MFRTHLWEELYTQMGFFVQSILAARYIHRREMWVVSLKNSSSLEFEIDKIFVNFAFFEELPRIEILCEHVVFGMTSFTFSANFSSNYDLFFKNFSFKIKFRAKKWINFVFLIHEKW